jgi:hypothetical protein
MGNATRSRSKQRKRSKFAAFQTVRRHELVATAFTRPGMTDLAFAHILRTIRRNQPDIAFHACRSKGRIDLIHHPDPLFAPFY